MTDTPFARPGTALVVGAASGIGRAVTELFASRGIQTVAADLDPGGVKDLTSRHENVLAVGDSGWDATDPEACDRLLDETVAALGSLDRVVSTGAGPRSRGSSTKRPTTGDASSTST